jgi:transcriptional regulator with XRE-family HTH domain
VVIVHGMFLRDLLPQHGITPIAALRQRLGLTKRYAWLLWHGKVALSADTMRRLHGELGVPLDLERLAEEVEDLRKTERRAVRSQLRLILDHREPAAGRHQADDLAHPSGGGALSITDALTHDG